MKKGAGPLLPYPVRVGDVFIELIRGIYYLPNNLADCLAASPMPAVTAGQQIGPLDLKEIGV